MYQYCNNVILTISVKVLGHNTKLRRKTDQKDKLIKWH